jgi:anti-sigma B factor antagonist
MKIETQSQSGQVVISVREDRLDAHNSAELKGRFQRLLEEGGHRLVVDLSGSVHGGGVNSSAPPV